MSQNNAFQAVMLQAIGEIKEANKSIATHTKVNAETLKALNDNNIIHAQEARDRYEAIDKQLTFITKKMYYIVIGTVALAFLIALGPEYIGPAIASLFKMII